MAIEKASYNVVLKEHSFEIREYEPMIVAISKESDLRGYSGFNEAFNYISGSNSSNAKIAMTTPVINDLENEMTTAFVMPKEYTLDDLPNPVSPNLKIMPIGERKCAVIMFSGNASMSTVKEKIILLQEWLKTKELTPIGTFQLARYNPPFIPSFMKRNEVLVEIS